jgi:hypothetical protein
VAPTATGRTGVTATATTATTAATAATGRACVTATATTATAATTTWRTGVTAATTGRTGVTAPAATTWRARVAAATGRAGMTTATTAATGRARVPAAVGCDGTGDGEGQCGDHHACAGGSQQSTACDPAGNGSTAHRISFSSCRRRPGIEGSAAIETRASASRVRAMLATGRQAAVSLRPHDAPRRVSLQRQMGGRCRHRRADAAADQGDWWR